MIHKKQYIALAFISLCTPITQAMHQQKTGSSFSVLSSSSTTFSAPEISTSPYATMSIEELTRWEQELSTQNKNLRKEIKHKIAHEWPAQHPCCNCLVDKKAQCVTLTCSVFSASLAAIASSPSALCVAVISGAYSLFAETKYENLIKDFSADERTQKEKIEKELLSVSNILDGKVATEKKEDNRMWAEYKRKKLLKIKEKSE